MDEILAKLRKSTQVKEEPSSNPPVVEDFSFDSSTLQESEPDTLGEPTSSQCQTPFQIMKMNFEKITMLRDSECTTIEEVNRSQEYKIHTTLLCIVRKIIRFTRDVVSLELIDDTGSISCSCTADLLKEFNIKLGIVLKMKDFSLWRINSNHINLVKCNLN
ncbi:hypothetical protein NGRA_2227 [Nosema granulosis]|uniref:Uncharacterized protein n=1 Tax=Nosema granulosis TaxID=83296 RepID=A0A9P6GXJ6_9MICR|nr:hypothetical protein NGRA_2227 [Nosema granulosis]